MWLGFAYQNDLQLVENPNHFDSTTTPTGIDTFLSCQQILRPSNYSKQGTTLKDFAQITQPSPFITPFFSLCEISRSIAEMQARARASTARSTLSWDAIHPSRPAPWDHVTTCNRRLLVNGCGDLSMGQPNSPMVKGSATLGSSIHFGCIFIFAHWLRFVVGSYLRVGLKTWVPHHIMWIKQ